VTGDFSRDKTFTADDRANMHTTKKESTKILAFLRPSESGIFLDMKLFRFLVIVYIYPVCISVYSMMISDSDFGLILKIVKAQPEPWRKKADEIAVTNFDFLYVSQLFILTIASSNASFGDQHSTAEK